MATSPRAFGPERARPLRRAEYDRLVRLGSFAGEKVELLHGHLYTMSPHCERHAFSITRLTKLLARAVGDGAEVRVQLPLAVSDVSETEPDLAVVPPGDYLDEHPRSAHLVIEVASSSLDEDRAVKGPMYTAAGVPEYWVVDVDGGAVEVFRVPSAEGYREMARHGRDATLTVPGFADMLVPVRDIVPAR